MGKLVLKRRIKLVLKRRIHESQLLLAQLKRNQFLFTKNTKNNCESWLPFSCTHSTSKLHWGRIAITDKIAHYVRWGTQGVRRGTKLWWWSDATGWPQNCLRLQTGVCACCCACARALWDTTINFDDQYKSDKNFSKLVFYLLQVVWGPIWSWIVWKDH